MSLSMSFFDLQNAFARNITRSTHTHTRKKRLEEIKRRKKKKRAHYVVFEIVFCGVIYGSLSFVSGPSSETAAYRTTKWAGLTDMHVGPVIWRKLKGEVAESLGK